MFIQGEGNSLVKLEAKRSVLGNQSTQQKNPTGREQKSKIQKPLSTVQIPEIQQNQDTWEDRSQVSKTKGAQGFRSWRKDLIIGHMMVGQTTRDR